MEQLLKYTLILLLMLVPAGCASTPGDGKDSGPQIVPTEAKILPGDTVKNISPLPNKTVATVRQFYSDGHHEDRIGYAGYDFNRDGRIDMLEVMDSEGRPSTYVYDFDFDGLIDAHERVASSQKKSQKPK